MTHIKYTNIIYAARIIITIIVIIIITIHLEWAECWWYMVAGARTLADSARAYSGVPVVATATGHTPREMLKTTSGVHAAGLGATIVNSRQRPLALPCERGVFTSVGLGALK